ncbi:MAG: hypothetical protein ACK4Y5_20385 [Acetobacteraceae bacterium]|jgi:hypothetical protein
MKKKHPKPLTSKQIRDKAAKKWNNMVGLLPTHEEEYKDGYLAGYLAGRRAGRKEGKK